MGSPGRARWIKHQVNRATPGRSGAQLAHQRLFDPLAGHGDECRLQIGRSSGLLPSQRPVARGAEERPA